MGTMDYNCNCRSVCLFPPKASVGTDPRRPSPVLELLCGCEKCGIPPLSPLHNKSPEPEPPSENEAVYCKTLPYAGMLHELRERFL